MGRSGLALGVGLVHGGSVKPGRAWLVWVPAIGVGVGLLCVPGVRAQPVAVYDGETVAVRADQLDVDLQKGVVVLTGNVAIERGDLLVTCARVEAKYDQVPNVTWALATGNVRAQVRGVVAQAQQAELLMGQRRLELRGGVRVSRAGAWMTAREAAIDLETRRVRLEQVQGAMSIPSVLPGRSGAVSSAWP